MDITVYTVSGSNWIQTFAALASPIAAIVAVGVYLRQTQLLKRQVNLALYKQRLDVYLALRSCLSEITKQGISPTDRSMKMLYETREVEFLFRPEIGAFIHEVHQTAIRFATLRVIEAQCEMQGRLLDAPNRLALDSTYKWLAVDSHDVAHEKFSPYLTLDSIGWKQTLARFVRRYKS